MAECGFVASFVVSGANYTNAKAALAPKPRFFFLRNWIVACNLGAPFPSVFPKLARAARGNVRWVIVRHDVFFKRSE